MSITNELATALGVTVQTIRNKNVAKLVTTNGAINTTRLSALKAFRSANTRTWPTVAELTTFAVGPTNGNIKANTATTDTATNTLILVATLFETVALNATSNLVTLPTDTIAAVATAIREVTGSVSVATIYSNNGATTYTSQN